MDFEKKVANGEKKFDRKTNPIVIPGFHVQEDNQWTIHEKVL